MPALLEGVAQVTDHEQVDTSTGITAAARRARVTIHRDGRTLSGRLTWWPHPTRPGRRGTQPRVRLDSGAYLSVPAHQIRLHPVTETT